MKKMKHATDLDILVQLNKLSAKIQNEATMQAPRIYTDDKTGKTKMEVTIDIKKEKK